MSEQEAPKIEFPCEDYPVKVMCSSGEHVHEYVVSVMHKHVADLDVERITVRESSKGRFMSVTFFITATGVDQLEALHVELRSHKDVHMVI